MALLRISSRLLPRNQRPLRRRRIYQSAFKHKVPASPPLRCSTAQPQPSQEDGVPPFSPSPLLHSHHHDDEIFSSPNAHYHATLSTRPCPKIGRLVLIRHGQSVWNVTDPARNLTARFTGWADIGLTKQGEDQAIAAGRALQSAVEKGILPSNESPTDGRGRVPAIDVVFCSLLKRSSDTMDIILEETNLAERMSIPKKGKENTTPPSSKYHYLVPIVHSWRLNERHYGALVGLSKEGAERLYGKVRLTRWRDSWDVPPPPMPLEMVKRWGREDHCQPVTIVKKGDSGRTCVFDPASVGMQHHGGVNVTGSTKAGVRILEHGGKKKKRTDANDLDVKIPKISCVGNNVTFMPPSESLRDTYERFLPLWIQGIAPHLRAGRTVLVIRHANTIRSMLFAIDSEIVTKANSKKVKIPSALPLVYEFVDSYGSGCLEIIDESVGNRNWKTGEKSRQTYPKYKVDGRECSKICPGNLRVLKTRVNTNVKKGEDDELRYNLNGTWVETEETKSVSFCTNLGQRMGEHDIA